MNEIINRIPSNYLPNLKPVKCYKYINVQKEQNRANNHHFNAPQNLYLMHQQFEDYNALSESLCQTHAIYPTIDYKIDFGLPINIFTSFETNSEILFHLEEIMKLK